MKNTFLKFASAILFVVLIPYPAIAQKIIWENRIHSTQNANTKQICVDKNNNTYTIGNYMYGERVSPTDSFTDSLPNDVGCVVSYDANGKFRWAISASGGVNYQTINTNFNNGNNGLNFQGIVSDNYGNITVSGLTSAQTRIGKITIDSNKIFIFRCDTNGNIKWMKEFDTSIHLQSIAPSLNAGICLCASFIGNNKVFGGNAINNSFLSGTAFIANMDSSGNVSWAVPVASFLNNALYAPLFSNISMDKSGCIYQLIDISSQGYINGSEVIVPNSGESYLLKLNPNGQMAWFKQITYDDWNYTDVFNLAFDASGNFYYPVFASNKNIFNNPQYTDDSIAYYYLVKSDSSGKPIWTAKIHYQTDTSYYFNGIQFSDCDIVIDNSNIIYLAYQIYAGGGYGGPAWKCISAFNQKGENNWIDTIDYTVTTDVNSTTLGSVSMVAGSNGRLFFTGWSGNGQFPWDDNSLEAFEGVSQYTGMIMNSDTSTVINSIAATIFNNSSLTLYPNPANAEINLKYTTEAPSAYSVVINDMTGKQIFQENLSSEEEIDECFNIQNLKPGLYILTVQSEQGLVRAKFIKD